MALLYSPRKHGSLEERRATLEESVLLAVRAHTLAKGMSGEENLERDKEKSGEGDRKRG